MASHGKITNINDDKVRLDSGWRTWGIALVAVGMLALVGAAGYSGVEGIRHFYFSYFHAFIFFLSLTLGSLFVVLVQHLTRAGWSVTIRRIAEIFSMNIVVMIILFLPIVFSVYQGKALLYPWATHIAHHEEGHAEHGDAKAADAKPAAHSHDHDHGHDHDHAKSADSHDVKADENFVPSGVKMTYAHHLDEMIAHKPILKSVAFYICAVVFFGSWLAIACFYYKLSRKQDETGDINITHKMQWWAPASTFVFALTITFAAWFFIMTISPVWYSTMFGVYYFAGCMGGTWALLILTFHFLTSKGYVQHITKEHFQDMGKFLFGFTVFWAYVTYSQYMLIWYANIPEETFWFRVRGATTAAADQTSWGIIAILLVVCRFALPFVGLLSKHVKRFKWGLIFWAVWILVFHYIDLYFVVMPELFNYVTFGLMEILVFVGIGAIWFGNSILTATRGNLSGVKDPRISETLAFENM